MLSVGVALASTMYSDAACKIVLGMILINCQEMDIYVVSTDRDVPLIWVCFFSMNCYVHG